MVANDLAENRIRSRAYQIYREHGSQPGHDIDDWMQAEYESMQLPIHNLSKLAPPQLKTGSGKSLVSLVQAAVTFGAKVLPHIRRQG